MPATTIHFVRHGEVDNPNHVLYERLSGFHLSARGVRMAQATAKYIATVPQMRGITAIYSSPLERTRETAREIENALRNIADSAYVKAHCDEDSAQSQESDIILDKRLIEAGNNFRGKRIGYGEGALWKNNNWKLVANLWKPSWGESYRSIATRVGDFVREQVRKHPGEQIVAVTHESPIWSYRHLLETGHAEHNMLLRHTALASITSITYDCETLRVLSITYVDPAGRVK
ncbi:MULTISPECIES: histidine phosphatase family protein [Gardnerella]|jgi:broad specificity phosphatase phoE|uniref:Histidine phosphatase family protein n=1 Tax=Gardnerella swidsinskii TaxID=2792979 RepID=A0A9X7FFG6_9BIFI|nr:MULTISPECIES: histidine phosphatase family protein [Gardnerella]APW18252.1 histidine phosphatase family protein [Gardnerella vaginalis]EFH71404.1 broad specificity phosphatase PhoE [Gardnerella vaginalis 5-1]RIY27028.1 histidine phosphatase family protein [Bifidobacteriaceae bacterium WP021]RIY28950.1 histidine phosphatase family protein [Bifidobacteriaceae bacterium NR016]MDK6295694.1 histidine phosphatase family protein [Gardnerella swidsinskii]